MDHWCCDKLLWLLVGFVIITEPMLTATGKVKMRIVHDSANYGYFANNIASTDHMQLFAKVKPANFSGPLLLKKLLGSCYNTTIDRYQYVFCPFKNMSQYEVVPRWNAYQGVLGVWGHWKIDNNTFISMMMTHGDTCGAIDRSVEVVLQCGRENALLNVTEPRSCHYVAEFATKLVCHKDSLLVYPRLSPELQEKWDRIWTDYKMGYVTKKGYNINVSKMLRDAGLTKFSPESTDDTDKDKGTTNNEKMHTSDNFYDLGTCNREYELLKNEMTQMTEEIESLKLMLDLNKLRNRTRKGPLR